MYNIKINLHFMLEFGQIEFTKKTSDYKSQSYNVIK